MTKAFGLIFIGVYVPALCLRKRKQENFLFANKWIYFIKSIKKNPFNEYTMTGDNNQEQYENKI